MFHVFHEYLSILAYKIFKTLTKIQTFTTQMHLDWHEGKEMYKLKKSIRRNGYSRHTVWSSSTQGLSDERFTVVINKQRL